MPGDPLVPTPRSTPAVIQLGVGPLANGTWAIAVKFPGSPPEDAPSVITNNHGAVDDAGVPVGWATEAEAVAALPEARDQLVAWLTSSGAVTHIGTTGHVDPARPRDRWGRPRYQRDEIPPAGGGFARWRGRITHPTAVTTPPEHDHARVCVGGWVASGQWWLTCGRCRPSSERAAG